MSERILGCDISVWQDNNSTPQRVDFAKMKEAGAKFVFIKASQGTWADPDFIWNWDDARQAGLYRGAYHYLDWRYDILAQADFFAGLLLKDPGELPPVLDYEMRSYAPTKHLALARADAFLTKVEKALRRKLIIYTSPSFWAEFGEEGPFIGWAIGRGETYDSEQQQDAAEAEALYEVLERDVIPTFYERTPQGLPKRWIARMKSAIANLCHTYNTHRMVRQYTEGFYLVAHAKRALMGAEGAARARAQAAWRERIQAFWPEVRIEEVAADVPEHLEVGDQLRVRARIFLGSLTPEEVVVELYCGRVDAAGRFVGPVSLPMEPGGREGDCWLYGGRFGPCTTSGLLGYTVRVLPSHPDLTSPFLPGYVTWAAP